MAELRHIESIGDTDANLQTNMDILQRGIQTDGSKKQTYKDADNGYHVNANSAEAESFTTVTATTGVILGTSAWAGNSASTARIQFGATDTLTVKDADLVVQGELTGTKLNISTTAGAGVDLADFLTPSMTNNQQNYITIGDSVAADSCFTILYNA